MPHATTDDGVRLYYEETGSGTPVIFVHEYAGDYRSWEPQMRHFGQRYRAITYNARGYPPSDVPRGQSRTIRRPAPRTTSRRCSTIWGSTRRMSSVCRWAASPRCISASATRRARCRWCVAGCGYGAEKGQRERFRAEAETIADFIQQQGHGGVRREIRATARRACSSRTRTRAASTSSSACWPSTRRWARATRSLACSASGRRLYDLVEQMKALTVPTLILTGDEDWPCLQPGLLMKQTIRERRAVGDAELRPCDQHRGPRRVQPYRRRRSSRQVDAGRWPMRDPRAVSASITGMR